MYKITVVFIWALVLILSANPSSAQITSNNTINYSPPSGQSGCMYSFDAEITLTVRSSNIGMEISYDIGIASLNGLIIDGKNISKSQLPASTVQAYENPGSFFKIPIEFTVSGGGFSQKLNSLGRSTIEWYLLFGGAFSHNQTVMNDYKERGMSLYNNGGIRISNVKILGTLQFDPTPWRDGAKEKEDQKTENTGTNNNNGSSELNSYGNSNSSPAQNKTTQDTKPTSYYNQNNNTSSSNNNTNTTNKKPTWQETNARILAENQQKYAEQQERIAETQRANKEIADNITQGTTELVNLIGGIINDAREKKEKRLLYEQQQKQKAEQAKQQEADRVAEIARKKALKIELRNSLFNEFPEGGVPLSSQTIPVSQLFYFVYVFDKSTIAADLPTISLSNIFTVSQYSDGTWPFKSTIISDIKKNNPTGTITLVGYFTTSELAEQMHSSFTDLARQSDFSINEIVYKGKNTAITSNTDFWESRDKKTTKTTAEPQNKNSKEEDFWETGNKKTVETKKTIEPKNEKGKEDDFWETGDKKTTETPVKATTTTKYNVNYLGLKATYYSMKSLAGEEKVFAKVTNTRTDLEAFITIYANGAVIFETSLAPGGANFGNNFEVAEIDLEVEWKPYKDKKTEPGMINKIKNKIRDNIKASEEKIIFGSLPGACMCVRG